VERRWVQEHLDHERLALLAEAAVTTRGLVVGALAIAGGFAVGRFTTGSPSAPARTERIVERGPQRTIVERAVGPDMDEVRRVIREELARGGTAQVQAAAEPAQVQETEGESEVALDDARVVLDTGMADGRWSDEDRARLRNAMATLPPRQTAELFDKLLLALNSGQLQADVHGAPI
jgi:hypothetical protein